VISYIKRYSLQLTTSTYQQEMLYPTAYGN
jgi:hypothetical protein